MSRMNIEFGIAVCFDSLGGLELSGVWNSNLHRGAFNPTLKDAFGHQLNGLSAKINEAISKTTSLKNFIGSFEIDCTYVSRAGLSLAHYNPSVKTSDIPHQMYGRSVLLGMADYSSTRCDLLITNLGTNDLQDYNTIAVEELLKLMDEGYDLRLMSEPNRNARIVYINSVDGGLAYEVIGPDGQLKQGVIPWRKLPFEFPTKFESIDVIKPYLQSILYNTSEAGHTLNFPRFNDFLRQDFIENVPYTVKERIQQGSGTTEILERIPPQIEAQLKDKLNKAYRLLKEGKQDEEKQGPKSIMPVIVITEEENLLILKTLVKWLNGIRYPMYMGEYGNLTSQEIDQVKKLEAFALEWSKKGYLNKTVKEMLADFEETLIEFRRKQCVETRGYPLQVALVKPPQFDKPCIRPNYHKTFELVGALREKYEDHAKKSGWLISDAFNVACQAVKLRKEEPTSPYAFDNLHLSEITYKTLAEIFPFKDIIVQAIAVRLTNHLNTIKDKMQAGEPIENIERAQQELEMILATVITTSADADKKLSKSNTSSLSLFASVVKSNVVFGDDAVTATMFEQS